MKLPLSLAIPAALTFPDAPDVHLVFMAGLVFLASIAGLSCVGLLLLLGPLATLLVGRTKPRSVTASSAPAAQAEVQSSKRS